MCKNIKDEIFKALVKRAFGYKSEECVEEYVFNEDGVKTPTKLKVTYKDIPPDISAVKALLELEGDDYEQLSVEELENEKLRLLNELQKNNKGD